jgi:phosphoserine phosphatase
LAQLGYEVDYENSFAYADSITDLGLFEIVGNPRPVYPDAELAVLAKEKGWPVHGKDAPRRTRHDVSATR